MITAQQRQEYLQNQFFDNLDKSEILEEQLKKGFDPNFTIKDGRWKGWTPLAYAVFKKNLNLVLLLLNHGANAEQVYPGSDKSLLIYSFNLIYSQLKIGSREKIESEEDYRIPFALLKFGATLPNTLDFQSINKKSAYPIYIYRILCWIHTNRHMKNESDDILAALARHTQFALNVLKVHLLYTYYQAGSVYRVWDWQDVSKFIKLIPNIDTKFAQDVEYLIDMALQNRAWELAENLITKYRKNPSQLKEEKLSSLTYMLINTKPVDFLLESNKNHQNPTQCFAALLEQKSDPNETFERDGKKWSLLNWAAQNKHFIAAKLLIQHGADADQVIPQTMIKLSNSFPIEKAKEVKSKDSLVFIPKHNNGKRASKEIEFGIDIHTAILLRIQESIDAINQEKSVLDYELENSPIYQKRQRLDIDERFYKLQQDFLSRFDDKAVLGEFKTLNDLYQHEFAKLKKELYEAEKDKAKARLSDDKITSSEAKKIKENIYLNRMEKLIDESAIKFMNFSVSDRQSLRDLHLKWVNNKFDHMQTQEQVNQEYDDLATKKEIKDEELRITLGILMALKNDLIKIKNLKGHVGLHNYLLNHNEYNRCDQNGFYPLHYACILEDGELAKKLHAKGAKKDILDVVNPFSLKVYSVKEFLYQCSSYNKFRMYTPASQTHSISTERARSVSLIV
ncbi:MAG: hypothetical protein ACYCQI_07780 [Gammaproteobacteria bacterium]